MVLSHIHRGGETRFYIRSLERGNESISVTILDSRNRVLLKKQMPIKYKGAKMHCADFQLSEAFLTFKLMREFNIVTGRTQIYGRKSAIRWEIDNKLKSYE